MLLLRKLFACRHRNYTWPRRDTNHKEALYVVCPDCSQPLSYDWETMTRTPLQLSNQLPSTFRP